MNINNNIFLLICFFIHLLNLYNANTSSNLNMIRIKNNTLRQIILSNEFIRFRKLFKNYKKILFMNFYSLSEKTNYTINRLCVDYYSLSDEEREFIETITNLIC